jgi:hypothetical protein
MDCDVPPLFGYNLLQITEFLQIQIVMVTEYKPFTEWQLWLLQYPLTVQRLLNGFDTLTVQGYNVQDYYGYCRLLKGSYGY